MNFGGPVWHASARGRTLALSREMARSALLGVGDARLGQWTEDGHGGVAHLRRRLTVNEAALVNPLRDIRDTCEERQRLSALACDAPQLAAALNLRGAR